MSVALFDRHPQHYWTDVCIWDLETGECLRTLGGHTGWVSSVTLDADGRRAVSASDDRMLKVWDLETGMCLRTLQCYTHARFAALDADGRRAVSAGGDSWWDVVEMTVWDLETGHEIASFTAEATLLCCALAPDGNTVVAGDQSGRVYFLRLEGA